MKTLIKFVADDGTEFKSETACTAYEALGEKVFAVMQRLPKKPEGTDFSNGGGYIQHNPAVFNAVVSDLVDLMTPFVKSLDLAWWKDAKNLDLCHPSWVARFAGEACPLPLERAWYRVVCTNHLSMKEYGQPYYVEHEHEAKQVEISP